MQVHPSVLPMFTVRSKLTVKYYIGLPFGTPTSHIIPLPQINERCYEPHLASWLDRHVVLATVGNESDRMSFTSNFVKFWIHVSKSERLQPHTSLNIQGSLSIIFSRKKGEVRTLDLTKKAHIHTSLAGL